MKSQSRVLEKKLVHQLACIYVFFSGIGFGRLELFPLGYTWDYYDYFTIDVWLGLDPSAIYKTKKHWFHDIRVKYTQTNHYWFADLELSQDLQDEIEKHREMYLSLNNTGGMMYLVMMI